MLHYTNQEAFDTIVNGLRRQAKKSGRPATPDEINDGYNGFVCLYRSPDGCKCGAGQIIPDEDYAPSMENKDFYAVYDTYDRSYELSYEGVQIVTELQRVHDYKDVGHWEDGFLCVAVEHDLTYTAP